MCRKDLRARKALRVTQPEFERHVKAVTLHRRFVSAAHVDSQDLLQALQSWPEVSAVAESLPFLSVLVLPRLCPALALAVKSPAHAAV